MFEEHEKRLAIAKDAYAKVCAGIDNGLKAAVSADPKHLKGAKAVQAQYPCAPDALELKANEQPEAPKAKKDKK